jgi:hypothetical protein
VKRKAFFLMLLLMLLSGCRLEKGQLVASSTPSPIPSNPALLHRVTPAATLQADSFFRSVATLTPSGDGAFHTGQIFIYPGPKQYAGDVLTMEIPLIGFRDFTPHRARITIDGGETISVDRELGFNGAYYSFCLVLPEFWDTTGQEGLHTIRVQTPLNNSQLDFTFEVEIFPADRRPTGEVNLSWLTATLDCCSIHYLSGTAADRDIVQIKNDIKRNMEEVEAVFKIKFEPQAFTFYFVDNVWGNGGYAFDKGIVINYLDRYYGPSQGLDQLIRHEATHSALSLIGAKPQMGPLFGEGIPVYVAGGHYNEEPLREKAAALVELGMFVPLETLYRDFSLLQHEARYLQSGALVAYLVEKYGWDKLMILVKSPTEGSGDGWSWLERAFLKTYEQTPVQLETELLEWLQVSPSGDQVEALSLTIELQNLRRQYQACCAPALDFTTLSADPLDVNCLSVFVREGRSPENLVIEILLAQSQVCVLNGDYAQAEARMQAAHVAIERIDFSIEPAGDYLEIITLLLQHGYEAIEIETQGNQAQVTAIREHPVTETIFLEKLDGRWEFLPPRNPNS